MTSRSLISCTSNCLMIQCHLWVWRPLYSSSIGCWVLEIWPEKCQILWKDPCAHHGHPIQIIPYFNSSWTEKVNNPLYSRFNFSQKQNQNLLLETSFHLVPTQSFSSLKKILSFILLYTPKVYQKIYVSAILFWMVDVILLCVDTWLLADVIAMW